MKSNTVTTPVPNSIGRWMYRQRHSARQTRDHRERRRAASGRNHNIRARCTVSIPNSGFAAAMMRALGMI